MSGKIQSTQSKISHPSSQDELCLDNDENEVNQLANGGGDQQQVNAVLNNFQTDLNKRLQLKKRRMTMFTEETIKKSKESVTTAVHKHNTERKNNLESFKSQFKQYLEKIQQNIQVSKETEVKMHKQLVQLEKHHEQNAIVWQENLKQMESVSNMFFESSRTLETQQERELEEAQIALRKDMKALQKKMLSDIQKEGLANMKKTLQQSMMLL